MKLKEYIKVLQKIVKENPKAKDYTMVYATDEEGNGFKEVCFEPSVGGMIDNEEYYCSGDSELPEGFIENSVCVN